MVWSGALTAYEANAIRNVRLEPGLDYSPADAEQLFILFSAGSGTATVGDDTWEIASGLSGSPGSVTDLGSGRYAVLLDGQGGGVQIVEPTSDVIPEPATMLTIGISLVLLGGYVSRRRHG
jgi:hypothetical protein